MPLERPWNDWYHCNGNTYGTWLPGDPRGFRSRHHRLHVEGNYKDPPPPGTHDARWRRSERLMRRPAVRLTPAQRRIAVHALVEKLRGFGIELIAVAVNDHHFHLLARFRDRRPKHWVGRAKYHASMVLRDFGLPGKVWAVRCRTLPICDRRHQLNVFSYIVAHRREGAVVWTFRDALPMGPHPAPTPVDRTRVDAADESARVSRPARTKAQGRPALGFRAC